MQITNEVARCGPQLGINHLEKKLKGSVVNSRGERGEMGYAQGIARGREGERSCSRTRPSGADQTAAEPQGRADRLKGWVGRTRWGKQAGLGVQVYHSLIPMNNKFTNIYVFSKRCYGIVAPWSIYINREVVFLKVDDTNLLCSKPGADAADPQHPAAGHCAR